MKKFIQQAIARRPFNRHLDALSLPRLFVECP